MRESDVDALVRGVWAAATGEASWVAALDPVAAHFGARMAVVQRFDLANQRVLAIESGGAPDLEDGVLQYLTDLMKIYNDDEGPFQYGLRPQLPFGVTAYCKLDLPIPAVSGSENVNCETSSAPTPATRDPGAATSNSQHS